MFPEFGVDLISHFIVLIFFSLCILGGLFLARFAARAFPAAGPAGQPFAAVPAGFMIFAMALVVVYTATAGRSLTATVTALVVLAALGVVQAAVELRLLTRGRSTYACSSESQGLIAVCVLFALAQFYFGPVLSNVTDSWTHLSIVNRLVLDNTTLLESFAMPKERYGNWFSPWHGILAGMALATGQTPIAVWVALSIAMPIVLFCAYQAFLVALLDDDVGPRGRLAVLISFIFLFPIAGPIARGGADYRIANSILLFCAARHAVFLYRQSASGNWTVTALLCMLTSIMSALHLIETMLTMLAIAVPLGFAAIMNRRSLLVLQTAVWGSTSVVVAELLRRLAFSSHEIPVDRSATYDFASTLYWQLQSVQVGWPVYASLLAIPFLLAIYPRIGAIVATQCVVAIIFSPLVPFVYITGVQVVGANLLWRTMFVFPVFLVIGLVLAGTVSMLRDRQYGLQYRAAGVALALGCCVSVAVFLDSTWKIGRELSYHSLDQIKYSQLNLYRNFYQELSKYREMVVLTDTFTSAPINAVTSNYVFTHRPWTSPTGRHALAKAILKDPASLSSRQGICHNNIQLVAVNLAPMPDRLAKSIEPYRSWLIDFYANREAYLAIPFLKHVATLDGIDLYKVEREQICSDL